MHVQFRSTLALGALTLLLTGVAGCLPIARTLTISPEVKGVYVREDGGPMAGARVSLSTAARDSSCGSPVASTVTDASGRFTFVSQTRREPVTLLVPFDRIFCYHLCSDGGGSNRWLYGECGLHGPPPARELRCTDPSEWSLDTGSSACFPTRDPTVAHG